MEPESSDFCDASDTIQEPESSKNLDASGEPLPKFKPRLSNSHIILPGGIRFPKDDKVENVIYADSQGKYIKKHILDPSGKTDFFTTPGITIEQFCSKLERREVPIEPLMFVKNVTLFMGGNDLAKEGTSIEKFLSILDNAVELLKIKFPEANIFLTDPIPRNDCKVDFDLLFLSMEAWAKDKNVCLVYLNLNKNDITPKDKIHINGHGIRKVVHALKREFNYFTYVPSYMKQPQKKQAVNYQSAD